MNGTISHVHNIGTQRTMITFKWKNELKHLKEIFMLNSFSVKELQTEINETRPDLTMSTIDGYKSFPPESSYNRSYLISR